MFDYFVGGGVGYIDCVVVCGCNLFFGNIGGFY